MTSLEHKVAQASCFPHLHTGFCTYYCPLDHTTALAPTLRAQFYHSFFVAGMVLVASSPLQCVSVCYILVPGSIPAMRPEDLANTQNRKIRSTSRRSEDCGSLALCCLCDAIGVLTHISHTTQHRTCVTHHATLFRTTPATDAHHANVSMQYTLPGTPPHTINFSDPSFTPSFLCPNFPIIFFTTIPLPVGRS